MSPEGTAQGPSAVRPRRVRRTASKKATEGKEPSAIPGLDALDELLDLMNLEDESKEESKSDRGRTASAPGGGTNTVRRPAEGLTNGLADPRGRTSEPRRHAEPLGRINGVTNGRINGITNGRINGITNGRINGITNGLLNGLSSERRGLTNGLTDDGGFTNGLGAPKFVRSAPRGKWKLCLIPLLCAILLLLPLFASDTSFRRPIEIDGLFGDWPASSLVPLAGNAQISPNVDIVRFGVIDNFGYVAFYIEVAGTALQGGGPAPATLDIVRIFLDTDTSSATGYSVEGFGADRMVELSGVGGALETGRLWEFDGARDRRDWGGWTRPSTIPAAVQGSRIETEVDVFALGPGPATAFAYTQSWDGQTDLGETPLSPTQRTLILAQESVVPQVLVGGNVALLRITADAPRDPVTVDAIQVRILGTAQPGSAAALRLLDSSGNTLDSQVPTSRDVGFSFAPQVVSPGNATLFTVVGDFPSGSGDTFGVRIPSRESVGSPNGTVALRTVAAARAVGYVGALPPVPRVDGGFSEWTSVSPDLSGEPGIRGNADIDVTGYGSISVPGSLFLYADVAGRVLAGTPVPEAPRLAALPPSGLADSDRDTVPDRDDPFNFDFNNDGTSDAQTNGDVDEDGVTDYGIAGGTDVWLNTTIPATFPPPYGGRSVSVYVGPVNRPVVTGDDVLRFFLDTDNQISTGYAIAGIGADRLVEVRGKDGAVTQSAVLAFAGSFPGEWAWTPISPVTVATSPQAIELAVTFNAAALYLEAGDFWGGVDATASTPALAPTPGGAFVGPAPNSFTVAPAAEPLSVPWMQGGPEPTVIDPGSNAITTQYNHQRKVVRAGDVPVDTVCDATNSDGCWYAAFSDQLLESASTTPSTETITTGTSCGGTFPTDVQTSNNVYKCYREADVGGAGFPQVGGSATSSRATNAVDDPVTLPASVASGDLVLVFHHSDAGLTRTFPGPWVEIKDAASSGGTSSTIGIAYLIASGGETSVTVTKSISERFSAIAIKITAATWHGTTPPEVSPGAVGATTTPNPDAVTASWGSANNLFIAAHDFDNGAGGASTTGYPTNYGSNQIQSPDVSSAGRGAIATRELAASSDDPGTFTISASDEWWAGTVVVRPVAIANYQLSVKYDFTGVPAGSSYTLKVEGFHTSGEDILVQVLDSTEATWTTRMTITKTSDDNADQTYTLTTDEYDSGSPNLRFIGATESSDTVQNDLSIDRAIIETTQLWDRIVLMRSSDTSGSTWGAQIILASGRAGDGALLLARDSTEPSIAIDSGGFLHVVWVAASAAGDQATMNLVRYTKTTVAFPTQSELATAGNWEAVTNVDDASPGFMPTVSTNTSNRPHVAWSGSKTEGTVYYKNKGGAGTIAVDSTVTSGSVTGAQSSITVSHTTGSGTDRLMLVGITITNDGAPVAGPRRAITSVTFGATGLTEVATVFFDDDARVSIYRLLNPAASTTANVVATLDANVASIGGITMGVMTFSGVDQTTPLGTPVTESEGDSIITVTAAANEWIFDTISTEDATALTAGADQTQRWALLPNAVVAGGASTQLGTANDIMSWTTTGSTHRAHAGVAIRPNTNAWGATVSWGTSYTGVSVDVSPQNNYVSLAWHGSATTSGAEAETTYRSNTGTNTVNSPKTRTWDGSAWSGETEQSTSGSPIRSVRMAWSSTDSNTRIVVTLSDDGWLDAYVCTLTCTVTNNIGQVWTSAPTVSAHRFDVAYESLSGEAMLVYSVVSANTAQDLAYRTYTGSWSAEQYIDDTVEGTDIQYHGVRLASDPGSNRVGLVAETGSLNDANAWIWSGSAWGDYVELSADMASASDMEPIAIAWETNSGHLIAATRVGVTDDINSREFTTTWSAVSSNHCGATGGEFLSLKPNPVGNDMIMVKHDNGAAFGTCYWTGSAWANEMIQDSTTDTGDNRVVDFAWESTGSKGLLVWGTAVGQITYRTFTAPNTWGTITNVAMGGAANQHPWVQLDTNRATQAGSAKILGAVLEATANDLGAIKWDGTTFTVVGASTFTADVGVSTFESFELEYPDGPWYDGAWQSRKKVTIDESKVTADLTNFPVLVDITDADLRDDAQDDGDDILFTASNAMAKLNHEIEEFNGATGKLVAWVNVTSLSSTVNTVIYMYYGNPAATNQQNAVGTWDGNHKGVWHLEESPNDGVAGIDDSTANNNDGTPLNFQDGGGGTTNAAGKISGADDFGGDDDYINVPNSASLDITGDKITIEAWIQLSSTFDSTATQHQTIIDGGGKIEYWLDEGDGKLHFSLFTGAWLGLVSTQASWTGGTWYHLVAVYDGANRFLYVNGVQDSTLADTGTLAANSYTRISDPAPGTNEGPFNGTIDEVRISDVGRSAGWAQTTYNNRNDVNFLSVGSEERLGAAVRQIQYLVCKDLATSNCDTAAEFTKADGTAGVDVVASGVEAGSYPSLATTWDANADLWVAYTKDVDATTRGVYARFLDYPAATWASAETVDSLSGTLFTRSSIGIDKDNNVHALYVATSGPQLYYNKRTSGVWGARVAVDTASDNPTFMVRAPNDLTFGVDSGGLYWKTTTSETYFFTSIPEFEFILVPIVTVALLGVLFRRRARRRVDVDST